MTRPPPDADLLVASVLGASLDAVDRACARLAEQLGPLAFSSEPLDFRWTDYYSDELGEEPARRIIAFDKLADAAQLVEIKRATARLEVTLSHGRRRAVNVDPGTLGAEQLVLASTKARGHRLHAGRGVYLELTLIWGPEGFAPLPWTYPDYASPRLRELFGRLRELLLETRRVRHPGTNGRDT